MVVCSLQDALYLVRAQMHNLHEAQQCLIVAAVEHSQVQICTGAQMLALMRLTRALQWGRQSHMSQAQACPGA